MSGFYCYICDKNTDETDQGGFLNAKPVCNTCWNAMSKYWNLPTERERKIELDWGDPQQISYAAERYEGEE